MIKLTINEPKGALHKKREFKHSPYNVHFVEHSGPVPFKREGGKPVTPSPLFTDFVDNGKKKEEK